MLIGLATDCKEAIEKVHSFRPDLIFMDIKLPGGNGLQLTKRIKTQYEKIVIIIVTIMIYRNTDRLFPNAEQFILFQRAHQREMKLYPWLNQLYPTKGMKKMGRSN
jgi:CheY-like chemotaxis protein